MSAKPSKKEKKELALNKRKEPLGTIVLDANVSSSLARVEEGMDLESGRLKPGRLFADSWRQFGRARFKEALEAAGSGNLSKMSALLEMGHAGPEKFPKFYETALGDNPRKISMPKSILDEIKTVAAEVTACCDFSFAPRDVLTLLWKAHTLEHQLQLPRVRMPDASIAGHPEELGPAESPVNDGTADAKVAEESPEGREE